MGARAVVFGSFLLLAACETPPPIVSDAGPASPCVTHADCDDGLFCTGAELCLPDPSGATFCVPGRSPCDAACDEGTGCVDCAPADADGDGRAAVGCGGDDCDDTDGTRAPGRREVCDELAHDEDCVPTSVGIRDEDGDGASSALCCNGTVCGVDCDDRDPDRRPGAAERCDGIDQDCDGVVDGDALCRLPGTGESVCASGACAVSVCAPERADCNGAADDGCERALDTDVGHCGRCDRPCEWGYGCVHGACVPGAACPDGYHACVGVCMSNDSPASCGSRCEPCAAPEGGWVNCVGGECVLGCAYPDDLLREVVPGVWRCLSMSTDAVLQIEGGPGIFWGLSTVPSARVTSSPVTLTVASSSRADTVRIGDEVRRVGESFSPIDVALGVTPFEVEMTSGRGVTVTRQFELVFGWDTVTELAGTDEDDLFGLSIAIDGTHLVVGAPGEDSGSSDELDGSMPEAGAAYVYEHRGDEWVRVAFLKADDAAPAASFGESVAISGNLVAVGAPGVSDGAGAVYVFDRAAGWARVDRLTAWNADAGDAFGTSVALDGSLLLAGAPNEAGAGVGLFGDPDDDSSPDRGAAYAFRATAGIWLPEQYFKTLDGGRTGQWVGVAGGLAIASHPYGTPAVFRHTTGWSAEALGLFGPTDIALHRDGTMFVSATSSYGARPILFERGTFGWTTSTLSAGYSPVCFAGDRLALPTTDGFGRRSFSLHQRDGTGWTAVARMTPTIGFTRAVATTDVVVVSGAARDPYNAELRRGHVQVFTP